jgi:hypothetical protein
MVELGYKLEVQTSMITSTAGQGPAVIPANLSMEKWMAQTAAGESQGHEGGCGLDGKQYAHRRSSPRLLETKWISYSLPCRNGFWTPSRSERCSSYSHVGHLDHDARPFMRENIEPLVSSRAPKQVTEARGNNDGLIERQRNHTPTLQGGYQNLLRHRERIFSKSPQNRYLQSKILCKKLMQQL